MPDVAPNHSRRRTSASMCEAKRGTTTNTHTLFQWHTTQSIKMYDIDCITVLNRESTGYQKVMIEEAVVKVVRFVSCS